MRSKYKRKKRKNSFIVFISGAILLVVILVFAIIVYLNGGSKGINLNILRDAEEIRAGVPFDLTVELDNLAKNNLQDVVISLNLPDGSAVLGEEDKKIVNREIQSIGEGIMHKEIFRVIILPGGESDFRIEATTFYSIGDLPARFERKMGHQIKIAPSLISLNLDAPEGVISGAEFDIGIGYFGDENQNFESLRLEFEYPDEFTIISTSRPSDIRNNSWYIDELPIEESDDLIIKGRVDLPDGSVFSLTAKLIARFLGREYVIASSSREVAITESPLSVDILTDNNSGFYSSGEDIVYTINYKNNTDIDLKNIKVSAKLSGSMFDWRSLITDGSFNQFTNTISWDALSIEHLNNLAPGEINGLNFSIRLLDDQPIKKLNDRNFTIKVETRIESPTVPDGISASKISNSNTWEGKIIGKILIDGQGFFRDAESLILNEGPWPPKVGQPTDFTIHLYITNFSTDVRDVEIRTKLEPGVQMTDKFRSNTSFLPEFDVLTGEVVWKLDKLIATSGITGEKPSVIFQVRATPSLNFLGQPMPLVSGVTIKALDEFTGQELNSSHEAITTSSLDDLTVKPEEGVVIQ
ncbi:MAG TPA: hypothetical protein VI432_01025 [Candidatus Paceibacterota bacterium]